MHFLNREAILNDFFIFLCKTAISEVDALKIFCIAEHAEESWLQKRVGFSANWTGLHFSLKYFVENNKVVM